ncbi:uncharacterized protein LOC118497995 [Phyllostomus discolor]|uniref:Uncharacterized protein LOC118497995 n=1 Tax=Phyllostomus discolor TaxID=89673 RepID=A0A7E6CTH6_9CHIR|nr:uncharacterized protein LOC118497995 [Phyllostomus discolor]
MLPMFKVHLKHTLFLGARNQGRGAGSVGPAATSHEAQEALDQGESTPAHRGARAAPAPTPRRTGPGPTAGPQRAPPRPPPAPPPLAPGPRSGPPLSGFRFRFLVDIVEENESGRDQGWRSCRRARGAESDVGGGTGAWGLGPRARVRRADGDGSTPWTALNARETRKWTPSAPTSKCQSPAVGARVFGLLEESSGPETAKSPAKWNWPFKIWRIHKGHVMQQNDQGVYLLTRRMFAYIAKCKTRKRTLEKASKTCAENSFGLSLEGGNPDQPLNLFGNSGK